MNWILITIVGSVGIIYTIIFLNIEKVLGFKLDTKFSKIFVSIPLTIIALFTLFVALVMIIGLYATLENIGWLAVGVYTSVLFLTTVVPITFKARLIKIAAIPYFIKSAFSKLRNNKLISKKNLDVNVPVKRSVYEITGSGD